MPTTLLQYAVGDATQPQGPGPVVIAHLCNDEGSWGRGFLLAVSKRWPEPEAEFLAWHAGDRDVPFELGRTQHVQVESELWVANVIGQHRTEVRQGVPPIRYESVAQGLKQVAEFARAKDAAVHMPRIGCGLAGGKWNRIEEIIAEMLLADGVPVTVYDLPTETWRNTPLPR